MKLILVVLAILGVSNALPAQRGIKDHAADFAALFDQEAVLALVMKYWNGGAMNNIQEYVCGDDIMELVQKIAATDEYTQFKAYLETKGIEMESIVDRVKSYRTGMCSLQGGSGSLTMAEFWTEFKALIPVDEIKALFNDKLANDAEFQAYWEIVSSATVGEYVQKVWAHTYTQAVVSALSARGWPIDEWMSRIYTYIWG